MVSTSPTPRRSTVKRSPNSRAPRAADIDKALDAAHAAADAWGKTSVQDRSLVLLKIADRIEQNLEILAVTETWDNGKAVRETLNADIPLAADHFRYYAGCIRAQEGGCRRDQRADHGLSLPRATGRGRADHPVELPAADGRLETRASPGRGQLHGAQARRANARWRITGASPS